MYVWDLILAGNWASFGNVNIKRMRRNEISEKTLIVFRSVFGDTVSLNERTTADDIAKWDSLNHIILIQELEKAFDIKFDLFEIIEIRDVAGIIDYIFSKNSDGN